MTNDLSRARTLSPEEKRALLESLLRKEPVGSRVAPLSFSQQRLWFLEALEELGGTYHIPLRLYLTGSLDTAALRRALDRIVARHEVLRTTFGQVDGKPVQRVSAPTPGGFPLAEHDVRGAPDPRAALDALVREEAAARFDLAAGPLIRGTLVRVADDEHALLVTVHHIVSDGWSMGVLGRELSTLYEAFSTGVADPLPALPTQYADFAAWQRRRVEGELLERQAGFWERTLAGAPELLELPADHPRPARQDFAGDSVPLALDAELSAALKALSRRNGTTLFMTLLAGWAIVLSRLSGQADVVVGTPTAGRDRREIEGLIGFFVHTLALRVDMSAAPTVAELLAQVRTRALEAQQHQDIPFEQVVERVRPVRSLAYSPLFQVMFAWQNALGEALTLPGLQTGPVGKPAQDSAKFDLSLTLWEDDGRITGSLEYATALFHRATVERHAACLRRVLEEMAADDQRLVERLPIMPESERSLVVDEWNRTEAEFPRASCIHELFEDHARRAPEAEALCFGAERVTYGELNVRANRLAHHLRARGVGPDVRVAICAERGPEMVVALLATLKAGGAYVPLDPAYPAERLRHMLHDSAPAVVLTQAHLGERLQGPLDGLAATVVALDADADAAAGAPETDPERGVLTPEHPAYVIYTSGSTGRPKGVLVPHRGLCNVAAAQQRVFGVGPDDRVLQFASFSFDAAAFELVMALAAGGALCLASREELLPGPDLIALLRRHAVTTVTLPPSALAALPVEDLPALRTITVAGEALPPELAARWGGRHRLLNLYGPTEATIWSTVAECTDPERKPDIGLPIANTRAYVLDARGEPVPVGVAGELSVGGAGVARGYLGRPGLTAERFVPDPFGGEPGARLYRTGDRVRWTEVRECESAKVRKWEDDAQGDVSSTLALSHSRTFALDFLGRTDHQVKVRGFRIELGEIEARLAEQPGVRESVVLVREDAPGETRLVAYVAGEDAPAADVLRARLGESLPEYMVPAAYVRMEALPLTPNGKLDRRALPAPEGDAYARSGYEPPVGETEQALADVWAEVLGVERVGRWDNFFDLGGHSLLAVQVGSRVRQALGAEVPLREIFSSPVLADLARAVEGATRATLPAIEPADRGGRLPLSFAQQRLWFLEQLGSLKSTYHIPHRLRLRGPLDRDALVRTLDRIVARHEVLRTAIVVVDGEPEQRITPAEGSRFALVEHDLGEHPDPEAALAPLLSEEAHAPFDLANGPLVRGRVVRLGVDDHVLLITMHHVVSDGWSMGVLVRELGALYTAFQAGRGDPLPPLPTQYADYAAWQRRWVEGDVLREQADYWRRTLGGAPELLELPTDHARPRTQDFTGDWMPLELDPETTAALKALGRRHGTTLYMTLLAGWAVVLSRLSGQEDVVIGSPMAGRGRREIEGLIGFFVNTLAVRLDASGSQTVAALLGRARARALEAQHHQDIPFEQVVELVDPVRSLAHTPLFQVMFTWQNAPSGSGMSLPGLTTERVAAGSPQVQAKYDLSLTLWEADEGIRGGVTFAAALFEPATVERWVGYLGRVLREMAADPARRLDRLALLPEGERALVVEEWNRTAAPYPAESCIHECFQAQAARTPDAVALVSAAGERVTYGELNRRANRLAHGLRARGVGPDVRVGLCVERSPAMVEGLLGILKAGGVFVPLDPGYPRERLEYMLADSAPAAVLAQGSVLANVAATLAALGRDVPVLELDAAAPAWADAPETDPGRGALTPAHPAYVTYTSGSTGRPKGVPSIHHKVLNLVHWYGREFGITERDSVLLVMSFSFDGTYRNLFAPLFAGGQLHLAGEPFDPAGIVAQIAAGGVCLVNCTPSAFQALAEADGEGALAGLRTAVLVGEAVQPRKLMELPEPRPELVNLYGPTECSGIVTFHRMARDLSVYLSEPVPVGRPIPNGRIYLLDRTGSPVPIGVAGELHIGGTPVGRGYQNAAGQTAEKFVPDPFGGEPGARLYRTGDRARWRPDGTIEFLGRLDTQVKVRGYRIEPGEIEARLTAHDAVREAVVLVREDTEGEPRLVAYWLGEAVEAEPLRAHLAEALPAYMVPAAYVRVEQWPLTPNGKLDRRALPAPEGDAYAARAYEAPADETEQALAEIWAEVLRVERVGRWDNFFELGGHSLSAVQVISRVRQVLEVRVALGDVFTRPVLKDFAQEILDARLAQVDPEELAPIEPVSRTERLPLSFAQQGLWFVEQLGDLGSTYHIPLRLRLRGDLDRGALVRALDGIVARHEALRTTFAEVDGVPEQRVAPAEGSGFQLVEHDLEGRADAEAELGRLRAEEVRAPFDLQRGPLIRGRLVRLAADDHVLLVTVHHIVSDAWSMGVLTRELAAGYAAHREGREAHLPALPVQYADYAAWQRRRVEGEGFARQSDFWKRTLAGVPELLELPTDHPRPAQVDHTGAWLWMDLDETLTAGLKALSLRHGTTLFMTLLAGWATVLSRLSGQEDVVVGTPTAGRERRETEGLIGFFVNTLAVRLDLSGGPTVAELLARAKVRALEAQHHQDIPFEQVVELIQPTRSMAHHPLFQVSFAWQSTPGASGAVSLPGLEVGGVGTGTSDTQAKFDLALAMRETGGRIAGDLTYATALFERATVERWAGYLRCVLQAMVADDRQPVQRLALMPADERSRVVEEWNRTDAEIPDGSCVHALFEQQVERAPDAVAMMFDGGRLTYAELNARANRLAHHLRALGVGPEARVALVMPRSAELVEAELAVLKSGGVYVPMDPEHPDERLREVLEDSAPTALLTTAALAERFAGLSVPVLALDAESPAWASEPATNPAVEGLTSEHLAYVIYTSGSTGRPKGVMVAHRAIVRLVVNNGYAAFGADDRVAFAANPAFDASTMEVWAPLVNGGRIVVIGQDTLLDPGSFATALRTHEVDVLWLTVGLFNQYAEALRDEWGRLRYLMVGGDALDPAVIGRVLRDGPPAHLLNGYGPTETTTFAVTHEIRQVEEGARGIPLGRPISNTHVYVLDGALEPVPVGVAGELCIGGAGLARGYQGRAGLTADRFIPDPFGAGAGARLYRTGDLVRWRPEGTLEFLGRTDHQVKVRGFRIEPGEIEARLLEHPGVREAVVLVREDAPGDRRLVAYVAGDETAGADVLRAYLGERLPAYMVPAAYVRLDVLPLTPNGKVDRRALPAPEGDAFARRGYEAPVGETEQALAGIWSDVVGVERVGRWDDFFDLGGHSLLAVQVISRVRQVLQVDVSLGQLFTRPVLADFARELETAARAELPPIEPAPRDGPVPLSFAQQRLWFLEQLGDLGSAYHIHRPLRLRGELDREALVRALDGIVARHEALRTTFVRSDGVPGQRIAPAAESRFLLVEHDLGGEADAEAELDRLMAEEANAPFGLERGPLIRGRLIRLAADDHVLLLTMHHIVSDGWSMGVLFGELSALYAAHRAGRAAALPALPVQYADFAAWQRRWVEGDVLRQQGAYWTEALAGVPGLLELPADRPRPAEMDHTGAQLPVVLDEALTAGIRALGRRHGTTPFMTVLAAWATVLGRLSGSRDVVIGLPTAGRGRREVEGLIGFFMNTIALRLDLSEGPTVAELLAQTRARTLAAQHHQDIPFEQVVELVDPARSISHHPLFQVLLTWQNTPGGDGLELPGLAVGGVQSTAQPPAKVDLSLSLREAGDRILGGLTYATALFDRATVERHVGYLRQVLQEMVADAEQRVDRLAVMPEGERARVVEAWNRTEVAYPGDACIHELFERQVDRTPDAVAVVYEGASLTYAELDAGANRLAHHLRGVGVVPEDRVALCMERGLELMVAFFGIMKAGAAYVPLEPTHPAERLGYMLRDSGARLLLTQSWLRERFPDDRPATLAVDELADALAAESAARPESGVRPENLAYVYYTSGSTGRPKGVAMHHYGPVNYFDWGIGAYRVLEGRGAPVFSSMAVDLTLANFIPLFAGERVTLLPEGPGVEALADVLRREPGFAMIKITPTHLALLNPSLAPEDAARAAGTLVIGADNLMAEPTLFWAEHAPGIRLLNEYGPTETVVGCSLYEIPAGSRPEGRVPIGRPINNITMYVLDAHLQPVPPGVRGELFIGGVGVARGYLGRSVLTAEKFVPDPFAAQVGARLYRTGDWARFLEDGDLEFLGRMDFQVKIRGYRIEVGEIEARLMEHPDVREAIVLAREDTPGNTRLVAYVVGDDVPGADVLRAHLGEALPAYMVPAAYVRLERLPLAANGKLERKALPAPEADAYSTRDYEPPVGETEEALAEIWAEVLGIERVGRWDNFFELGGHSLLAVTLLERMRQQGLHAEVRTLFLSPVFADFAASTDQVVELRL